MKLDRAQRRTLARVDDNQRRGLVSSALRLVYQEHRAVDSSAIKAITKEHSLVANNVWHLYKEVIVY